MTLERLLNMSVKFYTSPPKKKIYPQNKFLATPLAAARFKMPQQSY